MAAAPASLAAAVSGKVWLFALGPVSGATPVEPRLPMSAPCHALSHPNIYRGSTTRAFCLCPKRRCIPIPGLRNCPHVCRSIRPENAAPSKVYGRRSVSSRPWPDMPIEVFSSGSTDQDQLVMLVLDATTTLDVGEICVTSRPPRAPGGGSRSHQPRRLSFENHREFGWQVSRPNPMRPRSDRSLARSRARRIRPSLLVRGL